ncbi:hypothetical protein BGZ63DRAFT_425105 [Mariannaea sp. PMI_226]|nr:hypothetical protein BGZ63DRAFT_425105 [Mariannaea sp. PMI_226]
MYFKNSLLPLLTVAFSVTLTSALQINVYSDGNCGQYMGTYYPGDCDSIPQDVGSWLIVCENGDACTQIVFFTSDGGGCAGQYAKTALQCGCNADPWNGSQSRECNPTYGLGVNYWGLRLVDDNDTPGKH